MSTESVAIVDTGVANVFSITRAVEELGGTPRVTADPADLARADRIIIPGVGSFASTMGMFTQTGIAEALIGHAGAERPLLGICLGMQLLTAVGHEEGQTPGLGLIPGEAVALPTTRADGGILRRPHIGWSRVRASSTSLDYYFAHSFTVTAPDPALVAGTFEYGGLEFVAVVRLGSILGVQFHPERSGPTGLRLLASFMAA